jgi:ADP-heptose:LPS heptosyltransferase
MQRYDALLIAPAHDEALMQKLSCESGVPYRVFANTADWRLAITGLRALVTPDCGAAHIAGMAGVPCIDVFTLSPYTARNARRWRPWAGTSIATVMSGDAASDAATLLADLDKLFKDMPAR